MTGPAVDEEPDDPLRFRLEMPGALGHRVLGEPAG